MNRLQFDDNQGFTLVEVAVAVLIFAVGILGLAKLQLVSIKGSAYSQQMSGAVRTLEENIEVFKTLSYTHNSLGGSSMTYAGSDVAKRISWKVSKAGDNCKLVVVTTTFDDGVLRHPTLSMSFVKKPE